MPFTKIFSLLALALGGTLALAQAQNGITDDKTVVCLKNCNQRDIECISKCVGAPNPSNENASKTNTCLANCPKGNGTAEDNALYIECNNKCISENFLGSTPAPPPPATTSQTGTPTDADGAEETGSKTTDGDSASSKPASGDDSTSGAGGQVVGFVAEHAVVSAVFGVFVVFGLFL